jgi:hypothetical protein
MFATRAELFVGDAQTIASNGCGQQIHNRVKRRRMLIRSAERIPALSQIAAGPTTDGRGARVP